MELMEVQVEGIEELQKAATDLLEAIEPQVDTATVIGLEGELGAGKTTFVRTVADLLGIDAAITSPTYVLLKQYDIPDASFKTLVHVDAYRLENPDELGALDFKDYLTDSSNLIFIEWPGNVEGALPDDMITLSFEVVAETRREITVSGRGF